MEGSVLPAFEKSCKAMFDQVDATFQKGMLEHTNAAQQHVDSSHSSLAIALRVNFLHPYNSFIFFLLLFTFSLRLLFPGCHQFSIIYDTNIEQ